MIHEHQARPLMTATAHRVMIKALLLFSLLQLTAALWAQQPAQTSPLQQFDQFSSGLQSFSASFAQTVFDANGRQEEFSEGVFYLQQPDLMHWKYQHPYPQLIVADGSTLWSWDIELEQITRRDQAVAEQQSPLTLLTEPDRLRQHFQLQALGGDDDGLAWLELVPLPADTSAATADAATADAAPMAEFSRILVALDDGLLARMVLEDSLGQRTEVQFSDARRNIELDPELFEFVPPDGVDVLEG